MREIWDMLDHCAPGYQAKENPHNWAITWKRKTFPNLPLGKHGKRKHVSIQVGHVKKMARFFDILECAGKRIERLR